MGRLDTELWEDIRVEKMKKFFLYLVQPTALDITNTAAFIHIYTLQFYKSSQIFLFKPVTELASHSILLTSHFQSQAVM